MRIIVIKFNQQNVEVFGDVILDSEFDRLSVCFINSPSHALSEKIRTRIHNLKTICDEVKTIGDVSLRVCEAIARDELEEAYITGLSGKGKPNGTI